jgi:hypothetical protein
MSRRGPEPGRYPGVQPDPATQANAVPRSLYDLP